MTDLRIQPGIKLCSQHLTNGHLKSRLRGKQAARCIASALNAPLGIDWLSGSMFQRYPSCIRPTVYAYSTSFNSLQRPRSLTPSSALHVRTSLFQ
jgi:hypothetical protein